MSDLLRVIAFLLRPSEDGRSSRAQVFLIILAGVVSGAASTALIIVIGGALSRVTEVGMDLLWRLLALCLVLPIARFASGTLLVRLSQATIFDMRLSLSRRLLAAPLRRLEEVGAHRLLATLTDDTSVIADVFTQLPLLFMQGTVLIGCFAYLAWLSLPTFGIVLGFLLLGLVFYRVAAKRAMAHFQRMREEGDNLFRHFRGLTEGTKELKLHRDRRQAFLQKGLAATASAVRRHMISGATVFAAANSWNQTLSFLLIVLLFFLFLQGQLLGAEALTKVLVVVLYMRTPLDAIMNLLPNLSRARIAVQRINQLGLTLGDTRGDMAAAALEPAFPAWRSLELDGVTHTYRREGDDGNFVLGPINLRFTPGELVFVVGGNGSGKTTLAKLILGLYQPESGVIRLDGEPVSDENRERYLNHFSAVFTDFYLFAQLLGVDGAPDADARTRKYLAMLHLDNKVRVENGTLSTIDLSQGQRKRLALLTAYLENRPIYLFDEWAADQDPQFKEIFYLTLLPELKARGKTIIVISHDDRYYDVADRIIKLDYGSVVYDGAVGEFPRLVSAAQ
jgi:putative ATP-binding cassette transporter